MNYKNLLLPFLFICLLIFSTIGLAQNKDRSQTLAHSDEDENFIVQTSKKQILTGFGYGLGFAYQNRNLGFTNSNVLIDAFGNLYAGYFIIDELMIGGFVHGGLRTLSFTYDNKNIETFLGGGPRVRKYLKNGIFGELSYARSKTRVTYTVQDNTAKFDGYGNVYGVSLGFGNFWTPRVSLEIVLNYYYIESHYDIYTVPNTSSNFSITASISFATKKKNRIQ
ncbi:hypothetical protein [Flammeovirga sp. SJP92]|uniref:hypothetical protein n=1 Tax=Flammeovirga sp. SJP92 TaxID=1775430 RepID=UPI000787AC61|nr:hypothetical protein [Flammeovirga sp. SJP92]KXX69038.1 hypothetical protein AVL50_17940 [Flammeovirga sp. SJP92]